MKMTLQQLCSRFIDMLGLVVLAGVALSLAIPSLMPARVNAMIALPSASAMTSIDYANCLWYTARNEGFYSLQHAVATGSGTEANTRLWMQLVDAIEPSVCNRQDIRMDDLARALAETVGEADRHFMTIRQPW